MFNKTRKLDKRTVDPFHNPPQAPIQLSYLQHYQHTDMCCTEGGCISNNAISRHSLKFTTMKEQQDDIIIEIEVTFKDSYTVAHNLALHKDIIKCMEGKEKSCNSKYICRNWARSIDTMLVIPVWKFYVKIC